MIVIGMLTAKAVSDVEQTTAKDPILVTETTAASRSARLGLTAKTDRVSLPAPLLEALREAWNASFPSNTAVRTLFQGRLNTVGVTYNTCTSVDNNNKNWCRTESGWGNCHSSCPGENMEIG